MIFLSFSVDYAPFLQAEMYGGGLKKKLFKLIVLQKQWIDLI